MTIKNHIKSFAALLLGGLSAVACETHEETSTPIERPQSQFVQVFIAAPEGGTRTVIEENGSVTRWSSDDKIALWATDGLTQSLTAEPFSLWHFSEEFPTAYFTAFVPTMEPTTYTYYGAYPLPASTEGTTAYYDLPALQDGSSNLKHAVMVAHPVEGGSLTDSEMDPLHFDFAHKLHILKITIPESKNLLGEPLAALDITFPTEVTGHLAVDVSNPEAPVTLSGGSNVLSLLFSEPVDAGDTIYAVVAPVDASQGMITFRGYSATRESRPISTLGKNFLSGHTTPIRLTIPEARKITRIYFSLGENHLGENPNSFTVTVNGGSFPDGSTTQSFTTNSTGLYEFSFEGDFEDNFSGKTLTYTFDSDNAIVSNTQTAPTLEIGSRNMMPAQEIPYLFFEDFSTLSGFDTNGGNVSTKAQGGTNLTDNFRTAGWTGNQTSGQAGNAIRIRTRNETTWAFYCGRVDSAPMTGLKNGASVNVVVSFDYMGAIEESGDDCLSFSYGYTTTQGPIEAYHYYYYIFGTSEGGNHIENSKTMQLPSTVSITYPGNSEYPTSYKTISDFQIPSCTNKHRISWEPIASGTSNHLANSKNHWLYIDNVKVSIQH